MKKLVFTLLISLFTICVFAQNVNTNPLINLEEKATLAKAAFDAGEWDKAIVLYKDLVKANPLDKTNTNYLVRCYNGATSNLIKPERVLFFNKEILFATTLVNQNAKVPLLLSFRSVLYDWLGDAKGTLGSIEYTNAINDLTTAIKLKPEEVLYYFKRANIYQNKFTNKTDAALADINKAIGLGDKYNSYILLANIYKSQKKYPQAIETYDKAISVTDDKHDIAQLYSLRGDVHKDMNENAMAKDDYNKAVNFYPERMDLQKKRDDLNVATTGFETANISPNLINVTDVSTSLVGGAEYNKLVDIATELVWGFGKTKEQNFEKAILYSTEAIRIFPNVWIAYLTRAQAYSKAGKATLSESDVAKAKELADSRAAFIDRAMAAAEGRTYTSGNNNSNNEPASDNTKDNVCDNCHGELVMRAIGGADAALMYGGNAYWRLATKVENKKGGFVIELVKSPMDVNKWAYYFYVCTKCWDGGK